MTSDEMTELLRIARKIEGLLELLAEDKIAQRDAKARTALREIVGSSAPKQRSVLLMDGSRTQAEIAKAAPMDKSNLSKVVGDLQRAKLLDPNQKNPALTIVLPPDFFG